MIQRDNVLLSLAACAMMQTALITKGHTLLHATLRALQGGRDDLLLAPDLRRDFFIECLITVRHRKRLLAPLVAADLIEHGNAV